MSKAFSNLIKKGKKKASGGKDKETPAPNPAGKAAPPSHGHAPPPKSLDDQTFNKWVQDHQNEEEGGEDFLEDEGQEAVVLYAYKPTGLEDEIPLEKDEIIMVYEQHSSGWWTGQSKGGYGLFPGSYVRLLSNPASVSDSNAPHPVLPGKPVAASNSETAASQTPVKPAEALKTSESAPVESSSSATSEKGPSPGAIKPSTSGSINPSTSETIKPSTSGTIKPSTSSQGISEPQPVESPSAAVSSTSSSKGSGIHSVPASAGAPDATDDASNSAFLKTVVDQLYARIGELQGRIAELEAAPITSNSPSDLHALQTENQALKKAVEDMKIEKELANWNHEKKVDELNKEISRLQEQIGRNDNSEASQLLKNQLAEEQATLARERAAHADLIKQLTETQQSLRKELDDLRASRSTQPASAPTPSSSAASVPVDMMDQIKMFMQQQQSILQAQMQAELQQLKSDVAKEHQTEVALESQLADLKKQLEAEQKERAKLRQDLISQMSSAQINRIKTEVLERSEVREGKLWDPINNVFLAADGKWLRPTGVDLSQ